VFLIGLCYTVPDALIEDLIDSCPTIFQLHISCRYTIDFRCRNDCYRTVGTWTLSINLWRGYPRRSPQGGHTAWGIHLIHWQIFATGLNKLPGRMLPNANQEFEKGRSVQVSVKKSEY
jgi:hypothetical protein